MGGIQLDVATIVLAGGKGERLRPLTFHHAKPAVSIGGRFRLVDIPISNSIHAKINNIFVIVQYLSAELEQHIHQTYHHHKFQFGSVKVLSPTESQEGFSVAFKGTADAVRRNLSILKQINAEYFLILSGDQLYHMNFQEMIQFAKNSGAELTIASLPVELNEAKRMGLMLCEENGKISQFIEKPKTQEEIAPFIQPDGRCLASMGIYLFKREFLFSLLEEDLREDFGYHLIQTSVKRGNTFSYFYNDYWEDIGTISAYYHANMKLIQGTEHLKKMTQDKPIFTAPSFLPGPKISTKKIISSIICEGSTVDAEEISHSIVGLNSIVKKGSILRNSILMGHLGEMEDASNETGSIGEHSTVEKAIIDAHARIGNHVSLTNKQKIQHFDGEGFFVRDGIIVVPSGSTIPDFFSF